MKKNYIFRLILILIISSKSIGQTVTIGTGATVSTDLHTPFTTYWQDGRHSYIYLASEIAANGGVANSCIQQIGFNVSSFNGQVMNGFTIKMRHMTTNAYPTTGLAFPTGMTTVYTGNYAVPGTGWRMITLQTPFQWNGSSNIEVEICYDNATFTTSSQVFCTGQGSGNRRTLYQYGDNAVGCNFNPAGTSTTRPNIRFIMAACAAPTPPSCASTPTPANAATGVYVGTTLSWPAVAGATGYDVFFGTSPTPPQVATNQAGTTYNPGTLSASTTYYWRIVPRNSAGSASGCTTWSFTTGLAGCLNVPNGLWPSATYTPLCNGSPETITTTGWTGEYSNVNLTSGTQYTFSSSVSTDYITISNSAGTTILASGTSPLTWTSNVTGTVRFIIHNNISCATEQISRTRFIQCGTAPTPPPANDLCTGATSITCGASVTVNTANANTDAIGSTNCGTTITTPGVWYQIAGNGQQMTVSTVGLTTSDTKLMVFSGSCAGLTCVGGNDDFSGLQSSVTWNSVSGTNYYVLAGLFTGTGTFPMSLSCATPPPADPSSITVAETSGLSNNDGAICSGASVTLTAVGGVGTVYWFTGSCATTGQIATGNSINVSPSTTTTYFARNYNGTSFSTNCVSYTLTVNPLPTINAGTGGTICEGNSLQLNASSSAPSNGTLSTIFTGGNGCGAGNMFDLVAGPAPVTVNGFTLNPAVTGAQTVNVYYRVGTHVGNTTNSAAWTLLGAYTLNGTAATASYMATGNIVIPAGATYGIYVQYNANYTDGNGTNQTYSNANLTLNAGVGHCAGFDGCCAPRVFNGIIHYTVNATPTISWSPSTSLSSSSILNPVATPATTTTYTVTATANGCSSNSQVTVNVNALSSAPTVSGPASSVCPNSTVTLTASGGTAGTGSQIEWWTGPNGTGTSLGTGASANVAPLSSTTYYVRRAGTCNTTADATVTVNVKGFTYAANNTSSTGYCTSNDGWNHFFSGDNIIFSVQGNLSGAPVGFPVASIFDNAGGYYSQTENPSATGCGAGQNPGEQRFEMERGWDLNFGGGTPSGPYNVRFYYNPSERQAVETAAANYIQANPACGFSYKYTSLQLAMNGFYWFKNEGSAYTAPDYDGVHLQQASVASTPNGINYAELSGITSFSGGSGAVILSPIQGLPVELISFTANCTANPDQVNVSWSTASEHNSSHFVVERSTDGNAWEYLNITAAAGNSTIVQNYSFTDNDARGYENIYYRLVQFDNDGVYEVYGPVSVKCAQDLVAHSVYPNPNSGTFTLELVNDKKTTATYQVQIQDATGKVMYATDYTPESGIGQYTISLPEVAPGVYYLKISDEEAKTQTIKLFFR